MNWSFKAWVDKSSLGLGRLILSDKTSLSCARLTEAAGQTALRGQAGHFVFSDLFMIVCRCIKLLRESQVLLSNRWALSFSPEFIHQCRLCVCDPLLLYSILQCGPISSSMNPSSVSAANQIRAVIVAGLSSNYWLLTWVAAFSCCGFVSCYSKWLMEQFRKADGRS